ncbi:mechanosensitive ion channel [Pedobacter endophyticus]|uniref:Mechanosensitive ion channel n=2 Tax=Pedobacter endophyticus TaxID=2789740 RepID=A0A7S9L3P1_9SPHI|nr:mechanosensitive ion channel [Pedobacter endophyticus]
MKVFAKQSAKKSADEFEADKAVLAQGKLLEEIKKNVQESKIFLQGFRDSVTETATLNRIESHFVLAGDGVFTNKGSVQTYRNLTATAKILDGLLSIATDHKKALDLRQQRLNGYRTRIDSLLSAPALFKFPVDSVLLTRYLQQISVVAVEVHPVDSALRRSALETQTLLNEANLLVFRLQTSLDEIANYQRQVATNTFKNEIHNIWEPIASYRPFTEIVAQAKAKGWLTLTFYLENNIGKLLVMLLLISGACLYLYSLKSIYRGNDLLANNFEGQLVLRYPPLSAILIVINIFQFIFLSPPFLLGVIFWTISCVCLSIMFHRFITKYWMRVWLSMVFLFLLTAVDNVILQASRPERWAMLILALVGVLVGTLIVFKGKREELREKLIIISIAFMVILEFGSGLANVFGRYNLAKALLISGYLNVVIAILFLWTIRLINEGLFLAFNVYTQQDIKLFFLNFDKVGKRVPPLFYALVVLGWLILFGRNFSGFDYIVGPLRDFLARERTLGDYGFSINSLLLFFIIMAVALVISKIVSFFASDRHLMHDKDEYNNLHGVGSWLLLIRIIILGIGLFLAVAAAGIPIDRIAIVLGALGIGIGFGLQTMVNHLVSGLIIAFEKPVNVGDIVDIDGQAGTMKSVGFRSSVITTFDGADVVMPNGDLLNSHLINWTLAGNHRRISIALGVDCNADLEATREILLQMLNGEPKILKKPAPLLQYEQFTSNSIEVKLFFWVKDYREAAATKTDMIIAISAALKKNNINMPVQRQEIYVNEGHNVQQIQKKDN